MGRGFPLLMWPLMRTVVVLNALFLKIPLSPKSECSEDVTRRERPPYVYQFPRELERMHIFSFPNTSQIQSTKERAIAQRSITVMQWQGEAAFFYPAAKQPGYGADE